jgi:SWI/SNF-related matrix-associated actin-dependent regulator 1 of chromatin subfamily A
MRVKQALFHFQRRGVRFLEKTGGRALLCDDMGLGKTVQAAAWVAINPRLSPTLVACPSSLKWTWQREIKKFTRLRSYVVEGSFFSEQEFAESREERLKKAGKDQAKRKVVLRSIKTRRKEQKRKCQLLTQAEIVIINYDVLASWLPFLVLRAFKTLVLDECHYAKNRSAKRTRACKQLARRIPYFLGLSGTPVTASPVDFFPVLSMVRPDLFSNFMTYAIEYCAAFRDKWGRWDFSGHSNLPELRSLIKPFVLRRMKRKVLKDLPKKVRSVVPVDISNRDEYLLARDDFLSWIEEQQGEEKAIKALKAEAVIKVGVLKRLAAKGKIEAAINWIKEWRESTSEKLVVFTVHKEIMRQMREAFPEALCIDGSVSNKANKEGLSPRQRVVDQFQESKKHRLLFGQITAAGTGLTLTAGSSVLFLELAWNPHEHDQAEDRCLRIGQSKQVNVYYMVGRDTIEEKVVDVLESKDNVTSRLLDGRAGRLNLNRLMKFVS